MHASEAELRRVLRGPSHDGAGLVGGQGDRQGGGHRGERRGRGAVGHCTFVAQPTLSNQRIRRAEESIWPRPTPWRADDGYAWWRLCHDSPIDTTDSTATLRLRSSVRNGRRPNM